ncbi:MAG: hypothetical protein ACTSYC_11530 [Promethearchaeota archaeon]
MTQEEIAKHIKGIVICKESGEFLLDLILDTHINTILLSSFVGALSLFGKDSMGKIEEIIIKGLDIQIIIVNAHGLILITIVDKNFLSEDAREEAQKALEHFYTLYKDDIHKCVDISRFSSFKLLLYKQIEEFFKNKKNSKTNQDFGFFTEAIRKMREQKNT